MILEQMNQIEFNEELHQYKVNDKIIPSVTEIMRFITDRKYETVSYSILDNAKEKGTEVHFACEVYNKTGYVGISDEYKGYIEAYMKWIKDYNIDRTKIESEVKTYCKGLNYAGTIDMIYDKNTLIDIKTCSNIYSNTTAVQTSAYKYSINNQDKSYKIEDTYILWLSNNGNYKYVKLKDEFNVFLSCLNLYNFCKKS